MRNILCAVVLMFALVATFSVGAASISSSNSTAKKAVTVVEYYNAKLDHYFITADPREIGDLDAGSVSGWTRTGYQFGAYSADSAGTDLNSVCRLYGVPSAGLDSHFYSASAEECAAAAAKFRGIWIQESDDVFRIQVPDPVTGTCIAGTVPVYRVFNNRRDANHRYTTDVSVRQQMIAKGGIPEGFGPDGVTFCATPAPGSGSDALSATILSTQLSPDMFSFSSSIAGIALGASIVGYSWGFGDGTTASGAAVEHQFAALGDYPVTLTVSDNRGNRASTSKGISVRAAPNSGSNATPGSTGAPSAGDDFEVRRSGPGVIRWFDFDTVAQLGTKNTSGKNVQYSCGTATCPVIDTSVAASGAGSLRFDIPTHTSDNAAGAWDAEFSPDLSVRFGENSEFYVQWRQRFNQAFIDTKFIEEDGSPQGGIKQIIIGPGNTATKIYNSCEASHVVLTTYYQSRIPVGYNSCTGSPSHGPYAGFYQPVLGINGVPNDYLIQNGPTLNCSFRTGGPNCIRWVANEWMTFKMWIKTGPRNNVTHEFDNSEVKIWMARAGQPSVLLVWWHPGIPGYFPLTAGTSGDPDQSFGKVTLLPFMTRNSAKLDHPLAQTWYDDLIISREDIPDPAITTPAAVPTPVTVGASSYPAWRRNARIGSIIDIPGTSGFAGYTWPDPDPTHTTGIINAWQGFARDGTKIYSAASSGHNEWQNPVLRVDLATDHPKAEVLDPGSTFADVTRDAPYYRDGRPVGRHTYWTPQFVSAAQSRDGKARVMLITSFAAYGIDFSTQGGFGGGKQVDGFRLDDRRWDAPGTWPDAIMWATMPSIASDPRTGDVYYSADYTSAKWTAKTGQWTLLQGEPGKGSTGMRAWNKQPSLVDVDRNRLVGLIQGAPYEPGIVLQMMDLATNKLSRVQVSGDLPPTILVGFVHDLDNDRYVVVAGDGKIYSINPDTAQSTLLPVVFKPSKGSPLSRVQYIHELGGIVHAPTFADEWQFMPTR